MSKLDQVKKLFNTVSDALENRKERHRPTGFQFALADRIAYLNPTHWDAIANSASLFLNRAYLETLEQAGPKNLTSRYAMVFRGEKPVAIIATQIVAVTGERLVKIESAANHSPTNGEDVTIREKLLGKVRMHVLVCGNLLSWGGHGWAFAPDEPASELWPAVAEALYRIRRAERLSGRTHLVLVKDLTERDEAGIKVLGRFSYRAAETEPNMVLSIPSEWRTYDDYASSLTSKYRKATRQIRKEIEESGCSVDILSDLEPYSARLHELYLQVHENADVRPVTIPPTFFPTLARALGDEFRCIAIRRGNDVLGFVTVIRDRTETVGYIIGFDKTEAKTLPIYLRLLHGIIETAIEWQSPRLSFGRTALEPKARLGCRPEPMRVTARHPQSPLNVLVQQLLRIIPHDEAPERNPFK